MYALFSGLGFPSVLKVHFINCVLSHDLYIGKFAILPINTVYFQQNRSHLVFPPLEWF